MRHQAYAIPTGAGPKLAHVPEDASFTRSFNLCSLILAMHRGVSLGGGAAGRHHGWANLGDQEEPTLGPARRTKRSSSLEILPKGSASRERKGRRSRSPSLREHESRLGLVARTSNCLLQKSVGGVWSRISSANALQKERQGRVNGDLARQEGRRVKPSAEMPSEAGVAKSSSPVKTGEDRLESQNNERLLFSGSLVAKSGARVVGPGL